MALLWSARALDDLDRIAMFNEQFSDTRAGHVNWRLVSQAMTLLDLPYRGRPVGDVRELSVRDVQYVLTDPVSGRDVTILAIHSTREQRDRA